MPTVSLRAVVKKLLAKFILVVLLVITGTAGVWYYTSHYTDEARHRAEVDALEKKNRELAEQKQALEQFVGRLTSHRRVAEMVVVDQAKEEDRIESTTLLFVEYGPDGTALPGKTFTIAGGEPHIDSLVLQFDYDLVKQSDPLRGKSLSLFYRIYGERQAPQDGFRIDTPGDAPAVYRTASTPAAQHFETELWRDFWRLADDAELRRTRGVRVAQGEGVWTRVQPNRLYTLRLGTAGGITIEASPIDGVWKDYRQSLGQTGSVR